VVDPILAIREKELEWTVWHLIQIIGIDHFGVKEIRKLMDLAFERYFVSHIPPIYILTETPQATHQDST
jgi:hypothetical protein